MSHKHLNSNRFNNNNNTNQDTKRKSFSPDIAVQCKKIGNYLLSSTLGKGTFSKVKLGFHIPTKQNVAVKVLNKEKIKDENDIIRINREITILKSLHHPNIAQLYETITSDKHIYIIMEYAEGKDLFQYIYSKTYLTELKASFLFRQLISTLEYIHTIGIVHRDIKPENILLNKTKQMIKLVDFGLSNQYQHKQLLHTPCGSPCYASPEMISGKAYDGLCSDLWSCGVVLYCMLTGQLPFDDEDIITLYTKIQSADYVMPKYISAVTKDFLRRILTTDPHKRISIEEIKEHAFYNMDKGKIYKGIVIGIDDIPVDMLIVKEIKERYYKGKDKVTEDVIKGNIKRNCFNNVTAIYYLLLKVKCSSGNTSVKEDNKFIKERKNVNEGCCVNDNNITTTNDTVVHVKHKVNKVNFVNLKKINLDTNKNHFVKQQRKRYKPKSTTITNLNTNNTVNNNNNRFNVVVINTILAEPKHHLVNKTTTNVPKNLFTVNIDSHNKLNTSTSINNNVITTKIHLDGMINTNSKDKGIHNKNSRNFSYNNNNIKKTKTFTSLSSIINNSTYTNNNNNNSGNYSFNLNNTLLSPGKKVRHYYKLVSSSTKQKRKYNLNENNIKLHSPLNIVNMHTKINTFTNNITQTSNSNNKRNNKYYMRKIFENENSFLNPLTTTTTNSNYIHNNNNNNITHLNSTNTSFNMSMIHNAHSIISGAKKIENISTLKGRNIQHVKKYQHIQGNTCGSSLTPVKKGNNYIMKRNTNVRAGGGGSLNIKEVKIPKRNGSYGNRNVNDSKYIRRILFKNFSISMNKHKTNGNNSKVGSGNCSKNNSISKNKGSSNVQTPNNNNNIRTNKIIFSLHNCNFSNVLKKNFNKETTITKPKHQHYINPSSINNVNNVIPNNIRLLNIKKQLLNQHNTNTTNTTNTNTNKPLTNSFPKKQRAQTTSSSLSKHSNLQVIKKRLSSQAHATKPLYKHINN